MPDHLADIDHIVVLMLENRSFDHMLGFLYANDTPKHWVGVGPQNFEGLTGHEKNDVKNPDPFVSVSKADEPPLYCLPGANPNEGYTATCWQLAGHGPPLNANDDKAAAQGLLNKHFFEDFKFHIEHYTDPHTLLPGTVPADIMAIFTPKQLPVLSTLAREYAVCDYWFSSVPTMTWPNRAFACAGTCQGQMFDEKDSKHTGCYIEKPKGKNYASIFGMLEAYKACSLKWRMYHGGRECQAVTMFEDTIQSQGDATKNKPLGVQYSTDSRKLAENLEHDVRNKDLPEYTFIEPDFGIHGNCQHPNYNVDRGELLIKAVYDALRSDPEMWKKTLFIITYDEHGGCYDHVWPEPDNQLKPPNDGYSDQTFKPPFDFTRFGVRVPAVLVSPLIEPRTVCRRSNYGHPPFDHTSILKTIETRWAKCGLPSLTARDDATSSVGHVLTRDPSNARTDNPLQNVVVPSAPDCHPGAKGLSHLQQVHAEYIAQLPIPDRLGSTHHVMPALHTEDEYIEYIRSHMAQWETSQRSSVP